LTISFELVKIEKRSFLNSHPIQIMRKILIVFLIVLLVLIIFVSTMVKKGRIFQKGTEKTPSKANELPGTSEKEKIIEVPVEVKIEEKK
jgi:hypothetical protein